MGQANSARIDSETGFTENPSYITQFDAEKKQTFLAVWKANGLGLYKTCRSLGMSVSTVHHHYKTDPAFKKAFDEVRSEYSDELEAVSRSNALNPRSVIERIFQLKSLFPDRYGDQKIQNQPNITINIDGNLIMEAQKRRDILAVEPNSSTPTEISKVVDIQSIESANSDTRLA